MTALVTEGSFDEDLWRVLLKATGRTGVRTVSGGGRSAAVSRANTILVTREEPVVLVLDADTTDPRLIENETANALFGMRLGADEIPSEVFLLVPAMESALFSNKMLIMSIFGRPLTDVEAVRAEYEPKRTIDDILGSKGRGRILAQVELDERLARSLASSPVVAPVLGFVDRCLEWERSPEEQSANLFD